MSAPAVTEAPTARGGSEERRQPDRATVLHRMRMLTWCSLLTTAAFMQSPGRMFADTKMDLLLNPWGFMGRAMQVWDSEGFFGQLQNQAYGYFFPMGPFFGLLHTMHVPAWVALALWHAVLLNGAFLGMYLLAREFGFSTRAAVIGGLAYATAPRMLTFLGTVSSEIMPMAAAPWILLPLVIGSRRGSVRRAAMLSGVATLFAGGVNAVATIAVLFLPGLWLITRGRGPRQLRLILWWIPSVIAGTLWWMLPLLVLGKYSPPFLDWIESSTTTTGFTAPLEVLRGTSQWAGFLNDVQGGVWPAGYNLSVTTSAIIATAFVAAVGLAGILDQQTPERRFLALSVMVGVTLVGMGHESAFNPVWQHWLQQQLDLGLNPFRNVHKFEPIIRVPIVLGIAAVMSHFSLPRSLADLRRARPLVALIVVVCLGVLATPLILGRTAARGAFTAVPDSWHEVADYLAEAKSQRALVVPGSPFGSYIWGTSKDEPLQSFARTPWAVRDVVPLSSAGNVRLLDVIEQQLSTGRGSDGLAELLARSGIDHLVVRNDLMWQYTGATRPELVRVALGASPGISYSKAFGAPKEHLQAAADMSANQWQAGEIPPVEVWDVVPRSPIASAPSVPGAVEFNGGPEGLLAGTESGLLRDRAATLTGSSPSVQPSVPQVGLVTDSYRRQEHSFSSTRQANSPTMTADEPFRQKRMVHDYVVSEDPAALTTLRREGAKSVTASSSASDADAFIVRDRSAYPEAAVDGDPLTSWASSGSRSSDQQWWQIDFNAPTSFSQFTIVWPSPLRPGSRPQQIRVSTDVSAPTLVGVDAPKPTKVEVRPGAHNFLRIEAVAFDPANASTDPFTIAEVQIPGVKVTRVLRTPQLAPAGELISENVVLRGDPGGNPGCIWYANKARCVRTLTSTGEEAAGIFREFSTRKSGTYKASAQVVARPGPGLDALMNGGQQPTTTASSTTIANPWASGMAATDGDDSTAWIANRFDPAPSLNVQMPFPVELDEIQMVKPFEGKIFPQDVEIVPEGGAPQRVRLDESGRSPKFSTLTATRFTFRVLNGLADGKPVEFGAVDDPLRIAEVKAWGKGVPVQMAKKLPERVEYGCDAGPQLKIDGTTYRTSFTAETTRLLSGQPVTLNVCTDKVSLGAGQHRLDMVSTAGLAPLRVDLLSDTGAEPAKAQRGRDLSVDRWANTYRAVTVGNGRGDAYLRIAENFNPGWNASLAGQSLTPVMLDGWQQAFVLPAGSSGTVELRFEAAGRYRMGLWIGLFAVLALVSALFFWRRPEPEYPPLAPAKLRWVWPLLPLAFGYALGGFVGLGLGLALVAAGMVFDQLALRDRKALLPKAFWVPAVFVMIAAGIGAWRPWTMASPGSQTPVSQLLVLSAELFVLVVVAMMPLTVPGLPGYQPDDDDHPDPSEDGDARSTT